jgi:hypothetical protein
MVTKTKPMPVFWPEQARTELGSDRFQHEQQDPLSLDLLTWNVFQTLETHYDQDWLAYRLQQFGGTQVTAPVRLQLWPGRSAGLDLRPSRSYINTLRQRTLAAGATASDVAQFGQAIEVPVRIESPEVVCLVDTVLDTLDRGTMGRDRLLEVLDAGLDHARNLSKTLAVAVIYRAGSPAAQQLSQRLQQLRTSLSRELPGQADAGNVQLREVSWQQLLRVWESEIDYLDLPSSPKPFLQHVKRYGLY